MFSLEIIEKPGFSYSQDTLDSIIKSINKNILYQQKGVVNLVFLDPDGIQNLNKKYRNIDSVTDVLSFHYFDEFSGLADDEIAGEIVFCEEKIVSQGDEYRLGTEKEFYKLLIHSLLHLLGYDHELDTDYAEMKQYEDIIWNEVFEN